MSDDYTAKDVNISLTVQSGDQKDFDFDLSFDPTKFLGIQSDKLKLTGTGSIVDKNDVSQQFEFEGPIDVLRLSFHLIDKELKGFTGKVLEFQDYNLEVDTSKIKVTGA